MSIFAKFPKTENASWNYGPIKTYNINTQHNTPFCLTT